jgi:hypothetical protein
MATHVFRHELTPTTPRRRRQQQILTPHGQARVLEPLRQAGVVESLGQARVVDQPVLEAGLVRSECRQVRRGIRRSWA